MSHRPGLSLTVALVAALASIGPAAAQKQGGTLRSYIWDNPPSASIHEEATISTVFPFMPVFNNLVVFDQTKLEAALDTIVPDLALSWTWDATKTRLTFKLAEGVKWHDGKPFTAKDVKCTFDLVAGPRRLRGLPQEPAPGLVSQRRGDHDQRRPRGLLPAQGAAALLPGPARLGLLADLSLPRGAAGHARQAGRHRPVQGRSSSSAAMSVSLARNPDYWKKGLPRLDGIEYRVIDNRSTRVLAFMAGDIDLTFVSDITVAGLKDVSAKAPNAICQFVPSNNTINMIVNPAHRRSTSWRSGRPWRWRSTAAPSTPSSPKASR